MKIIVAGSTGFVGSEILSQLIAHNYITHIYLLSRRPHPDAKVNSSKRITQILHEFDSESYPENLIQRFRDEGVEACIWSLGGPVASFKNIDEARKVGVNYPAAAAEAFNDGIAKHFEPYFGYPEKQPAVGQKRFPFRFVFISGWGAEQDQFKRLWMYSESRKIKGAAEKALFDIASRAEEKGVNVGEGQDAAVNARHNAGETHRCFEVVALRPGGVLRGDSEGMLNIITEAVIPSIAVQRLAKTAIKVAFHGADGKTILENKDCLGEDWASVNSFKM
ncbi:Putative NAD(P)-binding domain superfamily [Septoria linicola]|uniref:NAD(P)-binding domain superfamily n=1 Tax=Septoria linicola TaxID=215465 RepID=A0A9Q9EIJ7_9PEZI|nr:putative NAD(P)-binding domain superfamily [Septoria linicola]USW51164.1 Putative NAD(P)-binding domain superfamily [Septoria linicola]